MPTFLRALSALSLVALLAACGGSSAVRPGQAGNPYFSQPVPGPQGKASPDRPPPSAGELGADVARFKGLAGQDVVAALGDPNYRRRETPAEVWQYFGRGCVLDLFLYDESGAQRVSYVELRSRTPGQPAEPHCLADLLDGRRGQPAS